MARATKKTTQPKKTFNSKDIAKPIVKKAGAKRVKAATKKITKAPRATRTIQETVVKSAAVPKARLPRKKAPTAKKVVVRKAKK